MLTDEHTLEFIFRCTRYIILLDSITVIYLAWLTQATFVQRMLTYYLVKSNTGNADLCNVKASNVYIQFYKQIKQILKQERFLRKKVVGDFSEFVCS